MFDGTYALLMAEYNHWMNGNQTHHHGQAHALLTAAGIDIGPTDLPVLPLLNR